MMNDGLNNNPIELEPLVMIRAILLRTNFINDIKLEKKQRFQAFHDMFFIVFHLFLEPIQPGRETQQLPFSQALMALL